MYAIRSYYDGGFDTARALVERLWSSRIDREAEPPRDAKTALQEWAQGRGLPLPCYEVLAQEGPSHAPTFRSMREDHRRSTRARAVSKPASANTAPITASQASDRIEGLLRPLSFSVPAQELDLGSALILCAGTEKDNGRSNPSILSDACEA